MGVSGFCFPFSTARERVWRQGNGTSSLHYILLLWIASWLPFSQCAQFPRQTPSPVFANATTTLSSTTGPVTASASPYSCCQIYGNFIGYNSFYSGAAPNVTVSTVLTQYLVYGNRTTVTSLTTVPNPEFNATSLYSFGFGSPSISLPSPTSSITDYLGNKYAGNSVGGGSYTAGSFTATPGQSWAAINAVFLWVVPLTAPLGTSRCPVSFAYQTTRSGGSQYTTTTQFIPVSDSCNKSGRNNGKWCFSFSNNGFHVPLTSQWRQEGSASILPDPEFKNWLLQDPAVRDSYTDIGDCGLGIGEGEPTVHIPVSELTAQATTTLYMSGDFGSATPLPVTEPEDSATSPPPAPNPEPTSEPSEHEPSSAGGADGPVPQPTRSSPGNVPGPQPTPSSGEEAPGPRPTTGDTPSPPSNDNGPGPQPAISSSAPQPGGGNGPNPEPTGDNSVPLPNDGNSGGRPSSGNNPQSPGGGGIVIGSQTALPGTVVTIDNTPVSIANGATAIVIGSGNQVTTVQVPLPTPAPSVPQEVAVGDTALTISTSGSSTFVVLPQGQTLTAGATTTIDGTVVYLPETPTAIIVDGSTVAIRETPAATTVSSVPYIVVGSETLSIRPAAVTPTPTPAPGDQIWNGIGGANSTSQSGTAYTGGGVNRASMRSLCMDLVAFVGIFVPLL